MIHNHCKLRPDHYWGVGQTTRPSLEAAIKAGIPRRSAAQLLRKCHNAVLLLAGEDFEQVHVLLTPNEARWLAEELLDKAKEVEARTSNAKRKAQAQARSKAGL